MEITFGLKSECGRREANQDYAFAGTLRNAAGFEVSAACVADGVGGGQAGERASRLAVESFCDLVKQSSASNLDGLAALAQSWAERLNKEIIDIAVGLGGSAFVGTTFTAFLVCGDENLAIHIGDSELCAVTDTSCRKITTAHNLAQVAYAQGADEQDVTARDHRELDRCLGLEPEIDVLRNPVDSSRPGWIVVTSDGVHEYVSGAALIRLGNSARSARELAHELVEFSLKAGTKDNATASVLRIGAVSPSRKPSRWPPLVVRRLQEAVSRAWDDKTGRKLILLVIAALLAALVLVVVPVVVLLSQN
jgi:protein phosphatase